MVVVDTSVAYKWFSTEKEQHLSQALALLKDHLHKRKIITSLDLILYELSNAWATKTRLSIKSIKTFLEDFREIEVKIEPVTYDLIIKATDFSKKHHVSVYDAAYAVLAQEKKCDLITANSKFVERINLPFIKHLKKYSN